MAEHYFTQKPKSELKLFKIKTKIGNKGGKVLSEK